MPVKNEYLSCSEKIIIFLVGIFALGLLDLINFTFPFISEASTIIVLLFNVILLIIKILPMFCIIVSFYDERYVYFDKLIFGCIYLNELFLSLIISIYFNYLNIGFLILVMATIFVISNLLIKNR